MTYDGRIEAQMTAPAGITFTATNSAGTQTVALPLGSYYPSDLGAELATVLNGYAPSGWTVALSTGPNGTLQWTIACSMTPFAIAWGSATTLRDILGFTGDITATLSPATGAKQGRGLWMPDCPINLKSDPRAAPTGSDLRQTASPTGRVLGLIGNTFYQHMTVGWQAVPPSRTWEGLASLPNASWEFFFNETQYGRGASWFTPSSKLRIFDHTGAAMGGMGNLGAGVDGWQIVGLDGIAPALTQAPWTGLYNIVIPQLISSGS